MQLKVQSTMCLALGVTHVPGHYQPLWSGRSGPPLLVCRENDAKLLIRSSSRVFGSYMTELEPWERQLRGQISFLEDA